MRSVRIQAGGPGFDSPDATTSEGAPSLRSLQGWESRTCTPSQELEASSVLPTLAAKGAARMGHPRTLGPVEAVQAQRVEGSHGFPHFTVTSDLAFSFKNQRSLSRP
jgi:hypothetical protein